VSFRTAVLPALDVIDSIAGPSILDIRPTTINVVTRIWHQGIKGKGGPQGFTDTGGQLGTPPLALPPYVRIRHMSMREVAQSGGRYEVGDVKVGPIRPPFTKFDGTAGGFTEAQLNPTVPNNGTEIIYRLTPKDPMLQTTTGIFGDYQLREFKRDMSMRFMLVLVRRATTP
jgi:hypothetical protein